MTFSLVSCDLAQAAFTRRSKANARLRYTCSESMVVRGPLQTDLCTLNVIVTLRGGGGLGSDVKNCMTVIWQHSGAMCQNILVLCCCEQSILSMVRRSKQEMIRLKCQNFIYTNPEDRYQKFVEAWCDVKGGGGSEPNVFMTLSVQKSVWRCSLTVVLNVHSG